MNVMRDTIVQMVRFLKLRFSALKVHTVQQDPLHLLIAQSAQPKTYLVKLHPVHVNFVHSTTTVHIEA